jgi:hypothetical protein
LDDITVTAGKLDDARNCFENSIEVSEALAVAHPVNTDWQRDLAVSYEKLGDVAVTAGKLDEAWSSFEEALAVGKTLAATDPANADWQRDLAVDYTTAFEPGQSNPSERIFAEVTIMCAPVCTPSLCPATAIATPWGLAATMRRSLCAICSSSSSQITSPTGPFALWRCTHQLTRARSTGSSQMNVPSTANCQRGAGPAAPCCHVPANMSEPKPKMYQLPRTGSQDDGPQNAAVREDADMRCNRSTRAT